MSARQEMINLSFETQMSTESLLSKMLHFPMSIFLPVIAGAFSNREVEHTKPK